jgi:hypothetical protein
MSGRLHCTEVPIANGKCIGSLYFRMESRAQMRLQTRLNYPSFAGYAVTPSDVRFWG